MKGRWRILLVVMHTPPRGPQLVSSEPPGLPPRDAALLAARLIGAGADVRVLDQDAERLPHRTVRREVQLWRADLVLLYAGGSFVADNPVPDERPLRRLLGGLHGRAPVLACGPLAVRYGSELLERLPRLTGALRGDVHPGLVGAFRPSEVPGLVVRGGAQPAPSTLPGVAAAPPVLPAWHVLALDACAAHAPEGVHVADVLCDRSSVDRTLQQVGHAVHRGGARQLVFVDRDFGAEPEFARELAHAMLAVAPAVPWSCRVRADRLVSRLALALANGGCQEVLVTSPGSHDAPSLVPMDDPARPRIESAVEAARVIGLRVRVEHVIGRPGHSPEMLAAWQRWYRDRRMSVQAHVRVLHAGDRGASQPDLREARARAGCWDCSLRPRDVERAVRDISERQRVVAGASGP